MFVVCWIPISIITVLKMNSARQPTDIESTSFTLALFNSVVNPFIYFSHLRKALVKAFLRIFRGRTLEIENGVTLNTDDGTHNNNSNGNSDVHKNEFVSN